MKEREAFERMLQEALAHLYDPSYVPPDSLWQALGAPSERSRQTFHARLVEAIRAMEATADTPSSARLRRYYELLAYRYVQELTQKETARLLQISPRHLRREQQQAVQALANQLYEYQAPPLNETSPPDQPRPGQADPWVAHVRQEMAVLQDGDPKTSAGVRLEMSRAVKLMEGVLTSREIALSLSCNEDLEAGVHPSVLRQVLITAIEDLAEHMDQGTLALQAQRRGESVEITVIGEPVADSYGDRRASVWSVLAAQSGAAEFRQDGARGIISVRFPAVRQVSVLVIDDNEDVVHVFRRYVSGTQYQIYRLALPSADVLQQVADLRPDIVVLDVLMPNMDGWELLAGLRQNASTSGIPVIVCSVIRREELAHALGAAAHLSKPVKSQQFLATLDRVWQAASAV